MSEDGKNRGIAVAGDGEQPSPPYYGTFQGVANYYPPTPLPPSQPVVGFPQPIPPLGSFGGPRYYQHGYQTVPVQGYAVAEGRPIREHRLPCCGLGLGWFLFIIGFFLGGIPWYVGTFILLCVRMDHREKAGLVACTVATVIALIAVTFGVTNKAHDW
ncbi:hypothetical protein L6164_035468 [Bauhinia variegata]|uniref:Uncharacterized protein n=1 Tax=Bauhinia variegata TaxID=167791 RepID=A0ACB9KE83_BAUVA|nr:hypothetical protein L6164_035468 [Bauhinia variegata]